jgi:hypothetical protein
MTLVLLLAIAVPACTAAACVLIVWQALASLRPRRRV